MKEKNRHLLNEDQKLLITLGAAMGGGCRKCAETLQGMALAQGVETPFLREACRIGLQAKAETIRTMEAKVEELFKEELPKPGSTMEQDMRKLEPLIRLAAFAAANSATDAVPEVQKALLQGFSETEIRIVLSSAGLVRRKAAAFFTGEVDAETGLGIAETGMSAGDAGKGSDPCSCGCE